MKTVKFTSEDPVQKQFGTVLRKNVHSYFTDRGITVYGNFELYTKSIVMFALYLMPFIVILASPLSVWGAILLVVLMGIGEAGIGMCVMHDAAHGAFTRNKLINKLFAASLYLLGGSPFNWKMQHNILHHRFTNIYNFDQDIETDSVIRLCEHAPIKKYHKYQQKYAFFLYGLMTLSMFITDFSQLLAYNHSGITKEQHFKPGIILSKMIISKTVYLLVLIGVPIYLTDFSWWQILIGFCILHVTAGMIMSTVFQMAHVVMNTEQPIPDANGYIKNEWNVHQLMTTADFARKNILFNWYVGGLNFQVEHHLFPNVCHIHYRKIAPIVERTAKEFGIKYNFNETLFDALTSHARKLKELGKHPLLMNMKSGVEGKIV